MNTVLLSFWRNDADRQLAARVRHLRNKTGVGRWLWVVGDSTDETERLLREWAPSRTHVLNADTGIEGEDLASRRRRISATETLAYRHLAEHYAEADAVVQHESDLRSPVDVVAHLARHAMPWGVAAGWPTLLLPGARLFYDTWAYRGLDGQHFTGSPPYHSDYRPDQPFEVASVGSVWMAPAKAWFNREIVDGCCVELCRQWRADGLRVWVDPTIPIEQPRELWEDTCEEAIRL